MTEFENDFWILKRESTGKSKEHHTKSGFVNPWESGNALGFSSFLSVLWDWNRKQSQPPPADKLVPVIKPDFELLQNVNSGKINDSLVLTWLGHAAMLVSAEKLNVLFDPCFSDRCSPVQFAGPKRIVPPPCDIQSLPEIDAVVISHNHYDHLDLDTIKQLHKPHTYFFVPLGNKAWFESIGIKNVVETDWWDEYTVKSKKDENKKFTIACTPCQHFSSRTPTDRNKTLWSSWILKIREKRFFFGGDTGYRAVPKDATDISKYPFCPAFREIGEKYGPFDISAIPIGAYSPRWFMSNIHCAPEDSVEIHVDIKSKKSIGMHWGTFILTDEPVLEPPERLRKAMTDRGLDPKDFYTIKMGESVIV